MQIFIMRHGEAELNAASDPLRELTDAGREQSSRMADWLMRSGVKIDQVLVSPYLRARQTLDVLRWVLPLPERVIVEPALIPGGDAGQICHDLRVLADNGITSVLIISHLPLVSYLVAKLCPQEPPPMFTTSQINCVTLTARSGNGIVNWQKKPCDLPPGH